jgi:hypothetical protein
VTMCIDAYYGRLDDRDQAPHKTLLELVADLELHEYVELERKGRRRGRGVEFYIIPTC